jgi:hypothetical protein
MGEVVPHALLASEHYSLLKSLAVQRRVLVFVTAAIATFLLFARTLAMLNLLRWVIGARIAVDLVAFFVQSYGSDSPDQGGNALLAIVGGVCWLAYLLLSRRVKHVFVLNDWDIAMQRSR